MPTSVWLLAVELIRAWFFRVYGDAEQFGSDADMPSHGSRRRIWERLIVDDLACIFWAAERRRWNDRSPGIVPARRGQLEGSIPSKMSFPERLGTTGTNPSGPNYEPEEESLVLAWGDVANAYGRRRRKTRALLRSEMVRLGPRAESVFWCFA